MSLGARVALQSIAFFVALALLVFIPAWSLHYPEAWAFLGTLGLISLAITLYLAKRDPKLLERRLAQTGRGERSTTQRLYVSLVALSYAALFVVSGLDHHFAWSHVAPPWLAAGYALLVGGYAIVFLVFRENTYTSAIVEVAEGQTVVSTGPYAVVRHPMYSGAILAMAGTPLALGSWVAMISVAPLVAVIVARLLDEEHVLADQLVGYREYMTKTRYRLVPGVW